MATFARAMVRLPMCAIAGINAGAVAGFILGLALFLVPTSSLSWRDLLLGGLALGLIGFFEVLLVIGAWGKNGVLRITPYALPNALLTGVLTVLVSYFLRAGLLSLVVGVVVGLAVGWTLCRTCKLMVQR